MESALPSRAEAFTAFDPPLATLDEVIITDALDRRAARPPDHAAENAALHALARQLGESPHEALQTLLERALALCCPETPGSSGISLLETGPSGDTCFRWTAIAGRMADRVGGTTPRDFSPCGVCLDRGEPVLYLQPARHFRYFASSGGPLLSEVLVIPFHIAGRPAGTIWVVSHEEAHAFDREDVRLLAGLSEFAGAVYAALATREAAEAANQAKGELLEMLSHDLRTPLASIGGYAEALERGARGPLSSEQRRDLARIRASQAQALALVDSVLEAARGENGLEYALADVPLEEVVSGVIGTASPMIRERRLTLDVELPAKRTLSVRADPAKLAQVLLNLLSNAVKFSEPGGRVELCGEPDGDEIRIYVRDEGVGIPADRLEDIFRPFVRVNHGRPAPTGAGLGLAISRRLVRGMGGRLSVESEPGRGSTFTVHLPASEASQ